MSGLWRMMHGSGSQKNRLDADGLRNLSRVYADWGGPDEEVDGVPERLRHAEQILHEVCHGLQLGMRIDRAMSTRVANRFAELNRLSPTLALSHEAHALAIQTRAQRWLGWRTIKMQDVVRDAWQTAIDSEDATGTRLPSLARFREMVAMYLADASTAYMGGQAAHHVARLASRRMPTTDRRLGPTSI